MCFQCNPGSVCGCRYRWDYADRKTICEYICEDCWANVDVVDNPCSEIQAWYDGLMRELTLGQSATWHNDTPLCQTVNVKGGPLTLGPGDSVQVTKT